MRTAPENPDLIDRLAAEYVLGTLTGAARRRFGRWREASAAIDARCGYWEARLMPLLAGVSPLAPSALVWPRIRAQLAREAPARRHRPMLGLALAASVLLVVLAGLLYWRVQPRPLEMANISTPTGTLLWQIEVSGRGGAAVALGVRAGALMRPSGRDYELWALPKGGAPVSLGLLPYRGGSLQRALTAAQQKALVGARQLAVSLEPPGGSPTGQPTGAIVYVVELHTLS